MSPTFGPPSSSSRWFKSLLAAGAVLAFALLTQTVINYQYVSESLIRQEARRVAEERVRRFERAVRIARPGNAAAYQAVLDDFEDEFADHVASVILLRSDSTLLAASGAPMSPLTPDERRRLSSDRTPALQSDTQDGRALFVGVFVCRCNAMESSSADPSQAPDRLFVQLAIYRDSLSAPFARLRRNAVISVSAALTLLVALGLIALRSGAYIRGKQIEGQLLLAREVQRALLPPVSAWPAGIDAAAACEPASQVGGDFYDVQALGGHRLAFALGDVSGHGIDSALLMGMMHGAINGGGVGSHEAPERIATRLNELLLAKSSGERFASLIWCVYDPHVGLLRYVNAGHPPGLLIRHDELDHAQVSRLGDGGPVLGVLAAATYQTASIDAGDGDLLVFYSDGIVETMSGREEYYGEGRLLAVVEQHRHLRAEAICAAVLSSARDFAGRRPAGDDRTILVIRLWRVAAEAAA